LSTARVHVEHELGLEPDDAIKLPAADAGDPAAPDDGEPLPRGTVLRLAWYTVPFHAVLPLVLWWLGRSADGWFIPGFFVVHLGFPAVLGITYPWWQGRAGEMVALVVLDHLVTFAMFAVLAAVAG
jgi:hypothetical protein